MNQIDQGLLDWMKKTPVVNCGVRFLMSSIALMALLVVLGWSIMIFGCMMKWPYAGTLITMQWITGILLVTGAFFNGTLSVIKADKDYNYGR